ncbi:hypothetical protein V1260_02310 [Brachybacterium sp. J144]|uniref:DUF6912 family protein n=1 Tax=Brachybacterium sp. J144 TaxID=3116487 RepID=UPI002E7665DD|nr:hypothetical protein [Brachybacterium sp. J144]MEE1649619.1 hypothetical protein [Brachybacterium sp. J144]
MRIYLPLTPADRPVLERSGSDVELVAGRAAWAVTAEARASFPQGDEEDLEYEALQEATHVALGEVAAASRALVIALDVPERDLASAEDGGAYGIAAVRATNGRIASFHVTELSAAAAEADDTDPALLWFDAAEGPRALEYLAGGTPD